jgi:hypothetical protein
MNEHGITQASELFDLMDDCRLLLDKYDLNLAKIDQYVTQLKDLFAI